MWLEGAKQTRAAKAAGAARTYWRSHVPVVEYLLRSPATETRVVSDPEVPDSILAFACTSGPALHWVTVKRSAVRAGFGPELLREVLPESMLEGPTPCTFEQLRLSDGSGQTVWRPPASWYVDPAWFARHFLEAA